MTLNFQARFRNLAKTAAAWAVLYTVLLEGEIGLESDTRKIEIGDGITAGNALAYGGTATVEPANIAALSTTTGLSTGQIAFLRGYYSIGDGGGQELIYRSTGRSGITIDSGLFFTGPGADDYFEAADKTKVDLLRFGCIGDGTTNNYTMLLVAASTAASRGIPIVVPKGTFRVSTSVTISSRVIIDVGGLLRVNTNSVLTLSGGYDAGEYQNVFDVATGSSVVITNKQITTPYHWRANGTTDASAFTLAVSACTNTSCPLRLPSGTLDLSDLVFNVPINGSVTIVGSGNKSVIKGPSTSIPLFVVEPSSGAKLVLSNFKATNFLLFVDVTGNTGLGDPYAIEITGCTVNNMGRGLIGSLDGVYYNADHIRIQDNNIEDAGLLTTTYNSTGIHIPVITCPTTVITGNVISNCGTLSTTRQAAGIFFDASPATSSAQSCIVTNNIVRNVKSNTSTGTDQICGILCLNGAFVIANNTVDNVVGPSHPSSPEGIYVKSEHAVISSNVIVDVAGKEGCIVIKGELSGSKRTLVIGNSISFRTTPAAVSKGILLGCPDVVCTNNTIEQCSTSIVVAFDAVIQNNIFRRGIQYGVEIQPFTPITSILIKGNTFDRLGQVTDSSSA
ncbi:MAG TPA: hypothetical protein VM260_01970, partial [Pirellula sp.]|nr:hypothetical protein [Pirellula sp.]